MELPFDELLRGLPPEVLDKPASLHSESDDNSEELSPEKSSEVCVVLNTRITIGKYYS